jgi:6-phosphogluconate dehydrogenase
VKKIFQTIAAKAHDGSPCCDWVEKDGAGHFVKMVHNGIEYGDMQMICEVYSIMKTALDMSPDEMKAVFSEWNEGELNSYLIEITGNILGKKDDETGKSILDIILDAAGQKGTGKWTIQEALILGCPAPTLAEAVFARDMSAIIEERATASKELTGPALKKVLNKNEFIETIRKALYASKICVYAQGYQLMKLAAQQYNWNLNFGDIALMWRGGCIIRARLLDNIKKAFDENLKLKNLLLDDYFKSKMNSYQKAWRQVVAKAVESGIPVPALSSALAYYDGYRSERLPANLLQAQRDYFGAHTYERIDKPRGEFFHTDWTDKGGGTASSTYNA